MNDDHQRADQRESLLLYATLRLSDREQRVRVRNLSAGGALLDEVHGALADELGSLELRNIGWVQCAVAWTAGTRIGLKFYQRIDPNAVRGQHTSPTAAKQDLDAPAAAVPPPPASAASKGGLFYVVRWLKGTTVIAENHFEHLLEAKAHAKDRFPVNRIRKGVTAAEVTDLDGIGYFRFD